MNDSKGILIYIGSWLIKRAVFLYAFISGSIIKIREKRWGDYTFSLAYGNDLFGAKLIAPHANKYWIKSGGYKYGEPNKFTMDGNKTISFFMAINKKEGFNTPEADWWEKKINIVDKDHLKKTLEKYYNELAQNN